MGEYAFDFDPDIPGGQVVFRAHNAGSEDHEMTMVVLPEDLPPLNDQIQSEEGVGVATLAQLQDHPPGTTGSFAVFLKPGRYGMICFVRDQDGTPSALKGMNAEFRVA